MTELQKPIPTIFLSDDDVCALSDWKSAITALENAYSLTIDHHMTPPRAVARGPGVWLRSMTAISPSGKYMGNKLIAASPKNKCVSYLISLFDTSTTHLAATIDGNHVTAFRTAALTSSGAGCQAGGSSMVKSPMLRALALMIPVPRAFARGTSREIMVESFNEAWQ